MRNFRSRYRRNQYGKILVSHVQNNLREYAIASIIFLIGIMLGVVFVNNLSSPQSNEISEYINNSIFSLKTNGILNTGGVLKESMRNNLFVVISLWLMGSTVIGLLLVYLIICFKGFCLGYTLSAIMYVLGTGKGIILFASTMVIKNIIAIPCIIILAVSGMKLYKSIMLDRRKENIKIEIIRHTLVSVAVLIVLCFSSFVEVKISEILLKYCLKYL